MSGIRGISGEDVEAFRTHGYVCKLVSHAQRGADGVHAWVQPTLYPVGQPEAAVPMNYNLITLVGDVSGRQSFFGQGAGRYPTAYNVVQDCVDFTLGRGYYAPFGEKLRASNDVKLTWYVRGSCPFAVKERWGAGAVTEPVCVGDMHRWLKDADGAFAAAIAL